MRLWLMWTEDNWDQEVRSDWEGWDEAEYVCSASVALHKYPGCPAGNQLITEAHEFYPTLAGYLLTGEAELHAKEKFL